MRYTEEEEVIRTSLNYLVALGLQTFDALNEDLRYV